MNKDKRPIVFLVLMLVCSIAMGQTKIGALAGLNRSKLSGDAPANGTYKNLMGGNFGAILDVKLSKSLYLSFQPSYSQEGTKVSYSVKGEPEPVDSIKIRLNYFSLPILLKVTSTNQRFYALTGFETGMLLNSTIDIGEQTGQDIEADIAQVNFAIHFGAGIHIPVGFPSLFVELRYSQGLVNITNDAWYGRSSAPFQTLAMAVFRAVENRRSLVRAANTGISCFVDPLGNISSQSEIFKAAQLSSKVHLFEKTTVYSRCGHFFGALCFSLAAILLLLFRFSTRFRRIVSTEANRS